MKIGIQAWGSQDLVLPLSALSVGLLAAGHGVTLVGDVIAGETNILSQVAAPPDRDSR